MDSSSRSFVVNKCSQFQRFMMASWSRISNVLSRTKRWPRLDCWVGLEKVPNERIQYTMGESDPVP